MTDITPDMTAEDRERLMRQSLTEADSLMAELVNMMPNSANPVFVARIISNIMITYGIGAGRAEDLMNLCRGFHLLTIKEIKGGKMPGWALDRDKTSKRLQ